MRICWLGTLCWHCRQEPSTRRLRKDARGEIEVKDALTATEAMVASQAGRATPGIETKADRDLRE